MKCPNCDYGIRKEQQHADTLNMIAGKYIGVVICPHCNEKITVQQVLVFEPLGYERRNK